MDTKSKSSKISYIVNPIILIILIITSIAMVSTYFKIEEKAKERQYPAFEYYDFVNDLSKTNYVLYHDIIEKKENKTIYPSDIFMKKNNNYISNQQENFEHQYQVSIDNFNRQFSSWKSTLNNSLKNLEYYAINKADNNSYSNNEQLKTLLENEKLDETTLNGLKEKYSFYVVIDFDNRGNKSIKNIYGAKAEVILDNIVHESSYERGDRYYTFNNITDATFVYAVPKDLKYVDNINHYMSIASRSGYTDATAGSTIVFLVIIILLALAIPYKFLKEVFWFKGLSKIPLEINVAIIIFGFCILMGGGETIVFPTLNGNFYDFLSKTTIKYSYLGYIIDVINVLYWAIGFSIVFMAITLIKHIFKTGFKSYMKEKSLVIKLLRWIVQKFHGFSDYLKSIDLREKTDKKLLLILGLNFLIIVIMCSMWFIGIIFAIVYSSVLFIYVKKYIEDLQKKYKKLLEATNEIAKGNLEVSIEEDLGVFNPFREEIENIEKGFKNAVDEEVKSQKMKTELISNVSHDLKTPLTSIITYIDLLKDESLDIEKRKSYLDTLDRKSQRLKDLIEDLFEVSKVNSGNITLNIIDVDIVSLIKQTQLELDDKIKKASLTIKNNFPQEKIILPLDSQRTYRIFENLMMNIVKYSMANSRVYIDIIDEEHKVMVVLKNMSHTELNFNPDEIVERFVRGDKSRNTEGSGLGLAIAKSFTELQGGKFNIEIDGDLFKVVLTFQKMG